MNINNKNYEVIQGRWWKIKKNNILKIKAKYHKIKDWKMDPKGYFLIQIDNMTGDNQINSKIEKKLKVLLIQNL